MKQPEKFTTDQPLKSGHIYLIQQKEIKKVCTVGSAERMNLTGHWEVKKEFKNDAK